MNKKVCFISNLCLLSWFFLDMTGMSVNGYVLVTKAFRDDGVFFLIFLILLLWYMFKPKVGKYFLTGWLFMWLLTQLLSHWYFTIFGPSEKKMKYFDDTIKLIQSANTYIPDLYHIVLHILILVSLANMIICCVTSRKSKTVNNSVYERSIMR